MPDATAPAPTPAFDPTVEAPKTPAAVVVTAPAAPAPGAATSEYAVTKLTIILSTAATIVGVATDFLQSMAPALSGSKWMGPLLSVLGIAGTVLTAIGYQYTRASVKAAAHAAAGDAASAANATAAAANLGQS
jgi:hypothetical protein